MTAADAIVVGAGPAGSSLALRLVRAGLVVELYDRARFPRDKLCGGYLAAEGRRCLERLGLASRLRELGAVDYRRLELGGRGGLTLGAALPRAGVGLSRAALDTMLVEAATEAGALFRDGTKVAGPLVEGGRTAGIRLASGERRRARLVVAADGRRSALAPQPEPEPRAGLYGLQTFLERLDPPSAAIELHLVRGGYAGLGDVEGGRRNLCLLLRRESLREGPDALMARLAGHPTLAGRLGRRVDRWRGLGPLSFGLRRPVSNGMLCVGDAAGTVDPFSGSGMAHALQGAELAAQATLAALGGAGGTDEAAASYCRAWNEAFAPATLRLRRLGRLLERPWLAESALLALAALGRPARRRAVFLGRPGSIESALA